MAPENNTIRTLRPDGGGMTADDRDSFLAKLALEEFYQPKITAGSLAIADTNGLQAALNLKANAASPTLTNPILTGAVSVPDAAFAIAKVNLLQAALDARPTLTMIQQVNNVKDAQFAGGAKGDGVSNDTAAINAAGAAAVINGMPVFFPPGVYLGIGALNNAGHTASFRFYPGVTYIGSGIGITILKISTANNTLSVSVVNTNTGATGIIARYMTIDGNNLTPGGETEVFNPKNAEFLLEYVRICNGGNDGADLDGSTGRFFRCIFDNNGGNGGYPSGYNKPISFDECYFGNNGFGRIMNTTDDDWNAVGGLVCNYNGNATMTVTGCVFENNARDLTSFNTGRTFVDNCHFANNGTYLYATTGNRPGIFVAGGELAVSDCTFQYTGNISRCIEVKGGIFSLSGRSFFIAAGWGVYIDGITELLSIDGARFSAGAGARINLKTASGRGEVVIRNSFLYDDGTFFRADGTTDVGGEISGCYHQGTSYGDLAYISNTGGHWRIHDNDGGTVGQIRMYGGSATILDNMIGSKLLVSGTGMVVARNTINTGPVGGGSVNTLELYGSGHIISDNFFGSITGSGVINASTWEDNRGAGGVRGEGGLVISAGATLTADSPEELILTGTTNAVNLPAIAGSLWKPFRIRNRGSGDATFTRAGADNVWTTSAGTSFVVPAGGSARVVNDGTYWVVTAV